MASEVGSMRPNPYLFDIENRKKRRPRLAHDLGAGAKCNKCGDKCPGFELHFWRKICMNCRCGKDDHEVEDDDEDIGKVVIGKLFDRPARTEREEMEYSYGSSLDIVNEETGKAEKLKFDWVPPNVGKNLASRYMELLPPEKRPVAGSEAAKARRRQLEQQVPLYDMDAAQRSDSLPPEELQNFLSYLERIKTQVAGQGSVQEIVGASAPSFAQPLKWQSTPVESIGVGSGLGDLDANGNIGYYPNTQAALEITDRGNVDQANIQNNNVGIESQTEIMKNDPSRIPDNKQSGTGMPSLRQQFLGQMVGEDRGLMSFKKEDPAISVPYGGTSMTSRPLYGLGKDTLVQGISSGLSNLSVQTSDNENLPGSESVVPALSPSRNTNQPEHSTVDPSQVPYSATPKGYRPVKPGHLQSIGSQTTLPGETGFQTKPSSSHPTIPGLPLEQSGETGYRPGQATGTSDFGYQTDLSPRKPGAQLGYHSENFSVPGHQMEPFGNSGYQPGYQTEESSTTGDLPGLPGYQDRSNENQPGFLSGEPGYVPKPIGYQRRQPGQPDTKLDQPGYQPNLSGIQSSQLDNQSVQPDYLRGQPGFQQDQPGFQAFQPGSNSGQPGPLDFGYPPGKHPYSNAQVGSQPGSLDYLADQTNYDPSQERYPPGREGHLSRDQDFPPPPPELFALSTEQPSSDAASIDSGVELYDNVGAKLRSRVDENQRSPFRQMLPQERRIGAIDAMQAPYGAQVDTLTSGISIAPGSDVNVLFPGESQLIKSPAKNSTVKGHKSKHSCQGCSQPMNVGDVAIFCERAGEDKCWHPACFSCFTCKELLADLIYFYKDGKVYCGRHFTESEEMPRCKACDELIFGNSWTRADGFDWHINHFCCNVCDTPMAGQRYVPDNNGYPYCLPCFMSYVAKMCEACEEKISPEVNRCGHRGYFYHATPECFKCYTCKDSLLGKRFKMSKNWVFCSNECIQNASEDLAVNTNPKTKEEV